MRLDLRHYACMLYHPLHHSQKDAILKPISYGDYIRRVFDTSSPVQWWCMPCTIFFSSWWRCDMRHMHATRAGNGLDNALPTSAFIFSKRILIQIQLYLLSEICDPIKKFGRNSLSLPLINPTPQFANTWWFRLVLLRGDDNLGINKVSVFSRKCTFIEKLMQSCCYHF
jgi:hypothetical protein